MSADDSNEEDRPERGDDQGDGDERRSEGQGEATSGQPRDPETGQFLPKDESSESEDAEASDGSEAETGESETETGDESPVAEEGDREAGAEANGDADAETGREAPESGERRERKRRTVTALRGPAGASHPQSGTPFQPTAPEHVSRLQRQFPQQPQWVELGRRGTVTQAVAVEWTRRRPVRRQQGSEPAREFQQGSAQSRPAPPAERWHDAATRQPAQEPPAGQQPGRQPSAGRPRQRQARQGTGAPTPESHSRRLPDRSE